MEVISIERSTYEVIDFVASLVEELLTNSTETYFWLPLVLQSETKSTRTLNIS